MNRYHAIIKMHNDRKFERPDAPANDVRKLARDEDEKAGPRVRGWIDFRTDNRPDGALVLGFGNFHSGLGRKELESYGAGPGLRMEFQSAQRTARLE